MNFLPSHPNRGHIFGRTVRIPLQSFIDIIYKVPSQQVQPKDDDSTWDRCESWKQRDIPERRACGVFLAYASWNSMSASVVHK